MKFTRTEWEIIRHRLDVDDAIIEVLLDAQFPVFGKLAIEDAIYMLQLNGCQRENFSDAERLVLSECCLGSTFFCGIEDAVAREELTRGNVLAYQRAAKRLEEKLNVTIPRA